MKTIAVLILAACLPLLAACQRDTPAPAATGAQADADASAAPKTALGRTVARAMEDARRDLREGNLNLDYDIRINGQRLARKAGDLPPAEITPDGDLVVSGSTIAMDDDARALARDYRAGIIAVAEAGMDLGVQGADLGMKAAGDAIGSLFRGGTGDMEKRIEAEARRLEASAMQLCARLPALLASQQALAAAVPEFVPYARMDAGDIDDCGNDGGSDDDAGDAAMNAAAEADAAADEASAR